MIRSLQCDFIQASKYSSATQKARVVTEHWCAENLYCVACNQDQLNQTVANTKAVDFQCAKCSTVYQVKSQRIFNLNRIVDGAYSSMIAAAQSNSAPNLIILNYDPNWIVNNLILVPESLLKTQVKQGL